MHRILSDLRILKLAQHLEDVFEAYEESLRDTIAEVPVRAQLAVLFQDSPAHRLLKTELARLSKEAQEIEPKLDSDDLLQTIHDCELVAHDFYLHQLDHVSSPALVSLLKGLAKEEREHANAVVEAMATLRELRSREPRGTAVQSSAA
jgi:hypothetical protein